MLLSLFVNRSKGLDDGDSEKDEVIDAIEVIDDTDNNEWKTLTTTTTDNEWGQTR